MAVIGKSNTGGIVKYGGGELRAIDPADSNQSYNFGEIQESTFSFKDTSGAAESILNEAGVAVVSLPADAKIEGSLSGLFMQSDKTLLDLLKTLATKPMIWLYKATKSGGMVAQDGKIVTQYYLLPNATLKTNIEVKSGNKRPPFTIEFSTAGAIISKTAADFGYVEGDFTDPLKNTPIQTDTAFTAAKGDYYAIHEIEYNIA